MFSHYSLDISTFLSVSENKKINYDLTKLDKNNTDVQKSQNTGWTNQIVSYSKDLEKLHNLSSPPKKTKLVLNQNYIQLKQDMV